MTLCAFLISLISNHWVNFPIPGNNLKGGLGVHCRRVSETRVGCPISTVDSFLYLLTQMVQSKKTSSFLHKHH